MEMLTKRIPKDRESDMHVLIRDYTDDPELVLLYVQTSASDGTAVTLTPDEAREAAEALIDVARNADEAAEGR